MGCECSRARETIAFFCLTSHSYTHLAMVSNSNLGGQQHGSSVQVGQIQGRFVGIFFVPVFSLAGNLEIGHRCFVPLCS